MASFRILDQNPVYLDLKGNLASGGVLHFYEAGTTSDKDVYGDPDLTVNNGPTIDIGTDGRAVDDIWGDGSYRVRLYAADGTLVWDRDDVQVPGGSGTSIPDLEAGKFLTNDGSNLLWDGILQPPDPTGQSGKIIGSDGAQLIWQSLPTIPDVPITVGTTSVQFGNTDGKAFVILTGSDEAPASGLVQTNKAVTYGQTLAAILHVGVQVTSVSQAGGPVVAELSSAPTTTGFTVSFDIAEGNSGQAYFNNPVPFTWFALGLKDVDA